MDTKTESSANKWFNQIVRLLNESHDESFRKAKIQERQDNEHHKELAKILEDKHKQGSVKIGKESYMTFAEFKKVIGEIYGDHLYIIGDYGNPMHGSYYRELNLYCYKLWVEGMFKDKLNLFE